MLGDYIRTSEVDTLVDNFVVMRGKSYMQQGAHNDQHLSGIHAAVDCKTAPLLGAGFPKRKQAKSASAEMSSNAFMSWRRSSLSPLEQSHEGDVR